MSVSSNGTKTDAFVGVDVGGTHTDVSVVIGSQVERGKALTTYDDFSRGVLEAVEVAAERFDLSVEDLLAQTRLFINGTTVVTNTITQLRGSRVGVLITSGFKDAFRFAGGPRTTEIDDHLQVNVPDLIDRRAIAEIDERVDWSGSGPRPDRPRRRQGGGQAPGRGRRHRRAGDLLPLEPRQRRERGGGGGGGPGAVPGPLHHPVPRRLPGRGRDPPLDHRGAELLRPGQSRRLPDLAELEAARLRPRRRARLLPGPRRRHQPRESPPVPARPARLRPGRRRDRRQRAGQADGLQTGPARRHGRDQLRHRDHLRKRDPHRQEPRPRPVPDRGQHRRRDLGRRRRRLDRLGLASAACRRSARRAPARPPARRRSDAAAPNRPSPTRW